MNEAYLLRVGFQATLDDMFPKGAFFTLMTTVEGRLLPGEGMITPRVFVTDVARNREGWSWRLFLEPVFDRGSGFGQAPEGDPGVFPPVEVWCSGLYDVEGVPGLWSAPVLDEEGAEVVGVTLRITSDLAGPRAMPGRMRDEQTERWEALFFPEGLEVVADGSSAG